MISFLQKTPYRYPKPLLTQSKINHSPFFKIHEDREDIYYIQFTIFWCNKCSCQWMGM